MSVVTLNAISEPLQLWQKTVKEVSPSFVSAVSVSGKCDTRDRQVNLTCELSRSKEAESLLKEFGSYMDKELTHRCLPEGLRKCQT